MDVFIASLGRRGEKRNAALYEMASRRASISLYFNGKPSISGTAVAAQPHTLKSRVAL